MIIRPKAPSLAPWPAHAAGGPYAQDLTLLLSFGEGGGSTARSREGHNIGTIHGTPAWRSSPIGPALVLDGSTNWVEVPADLNSYTGTANQAFSIAVWFYWHSNAETYGLVYGEEDSGFNMAMFVKNTGNIAVYYGNAGNIDPVSGVTLSSDHWHHYVWTNGIDGGTCIFIDGQSVERANNWLSPVSGNGSNRARIGGGSIFGSGRYINGALASVVKWARQLNPAEVQRLYQEPMSLYQPYRRIWFAGPSAGPQTVTLSSAVAGPRAIPSPVVGYSSQTVSMTAAVGPHRFIANPTVAGPITMTAAVAGPRAVGSPTVKLAQTVSLASAVIGPRSIPTGARVANVITIRPAVVAGPRAIPSPTITGGPQYISVGTPLSGGVKGPRNIPVPTITGGSTVCSLLLSGTSVAWGISDQHTALQVQSQTLGRWTMQFDIDDQEESYVPKLGETVILVDLGARLFGGCLTKIVRERRMMTSSSVYHCQATDKSSICDHRVVAGKQYLIADWPDYTNVILDVCSNFLNGEGINTSGVPASLGALAADLKVNFPTVTQMFDQIARDGGFVWWIDAYSILHFSPLNDLPAAPFNLTETSGNWRNMTVTSTTTDYYNKLYAVSNLNIVPGAGSGGGGTNGFTESFTLTVGQPGVVTNQFGDAAGVLTSVPIGTVISMTVNGHAQTVYDFENNYKGQTRSGSNDYLWVFAAGASQLSWTYQPPAGASISVEYTPYVASSSSLAQYGSALSPLDPHGAPLGTCGSGVYEGVVQLQNTTSQDDLNAIAAAELARIGSVPTLVDYETDYPGLAPGQKQTINVPLSGADNISVMLTNITGTYIAPDAALGHGGSFRWRIEGTTNLDPGNATAWYERLLKRTQNPLPVLQYEAMTFVLGAGSSVAAADSQTNPYFVRRTGLLIELLLGAATPPVDQTLVLQLSRNGVVIATVSMPASTVANELITLDVPAANQIYLYKNDVLNVNASYSVTGADPQPAADVTLEVRWSM